MEATAPSLVVPIHWDDFTRPLGEPLVPFPRFVDDVGATLRDLRALAGDTTPLALFRAGQRVPILPR